MKKTEGWLKPEVYDLFNSIGLNIVSQWFCRCLNEFSWDEVFYHRKVRTNKIWQKFLAVFLPLPSRHLPAQG